MGLVASEVQRLVALGAPVLCADTCSILDIMRDPTREEARSHNFQAALDLVAKMASHGKLVSLLAPQVQRELNANTAEVEDVTKSKISKFKQQADRVFAIARIFGVTGTVELSDLPRFAVGARSAFDRWIAASTPTVQSAGVADRAIARMDIGRTPGKPGGGLVKDCIVIETYLEAVTELRDAGLKSKIVFLSSNTRDYAGRDDSGLNHDLKAEFDPLEIVYASNASHAKVLLGV
ncbi:hypothetical protein B0G81_6472 [Paraburkholderia sp. BL6665CI2N2]|uniref:hypothetical protein n=1 Tax=Paraburkholderia sp. BL6665CI2N2 TaxID=1938806 RepID=UPI001065AF93|nr:hypothetical protein [Paraburkholderia sp. BL6665CI2N2]TDY25975.1 hypothetical protein B0G81_6472 [Paraburkholderia sp. BL6665CI2N2]